MTLTAGLVLRIADECGIAPSVLWEVLHGVVEESSG